MIPLLILAVWALALLLVVGLCVAARLGDLAPAELASPAGAGFAAYAASRR